MFQICAAHYRVPERAGIDSAGSVLKQNGLASNHLFYEAGNKCAICRDTDSENKCMN
jgi:hypothetical protein